MARQRPAKRNLVRWSDDLDKGVMLSMQYACAEAGIKIPWGRVAEIMGPVFTEGAIVQHLAKLRGLMAKNGIPVPPALKRGMVTKSPSKVYAMANNKHKFPPIAPLHPGSPNIKTEGEEAKPVVENSNKATPKKEKKEKAKPKGKGKAKARGRTSSEDEDEDLIPDLYDTDEDFGIPAKATKKRRTNKQGKAKKTASKQQEPLALMPAEVPETDSQDNITIKVEEEEDFAGPATRTRGVKRNYSTMAADNSDEEQDFNENNEATAAAAAADGSSDHDMVDDAEGVDDEVDYDVDAQVDAEVDTDIDTDVDEEVGGNEYCSDQDTEIEDDEDSCASTEILEDAPTSRGMHIADTPYGQITMGPLNDPLGLYGTEDETSVLSNSVLFGANPANIFDPRNVGASAMAPNVLMNATMPGNQSFNGFGVAGVGSIYGAGAGYYGAQYSPTGMGMTSHIQQERQGFLHHPSMYIKSAEASFAASRRKNSVTASMLTESLPAMPNSETLFNGIIGGSPGNVHSGDVITEQDMRDSMPSEEIFFGEDEFFMAEED